MIPVTDATSHRITSLVVELSLHKVMSPDAYQSEYAKLMQPLHKSNAAARAYIPTVAAVLAATLVLLCITDVETLLVIGPFPLLLAAYGFHLSSRIVQEKQRLTEFKARFRQMSDAEMHELAKAVKATGDKAFADAVVSVFVQHGLVRINERDMISTILRLYDEYRGGEAFRQMMSDHMDTVPDLAHS
jgi:hypothetical protein